MCISSLPFWGYGAKAIYPYLAHECIAELIDNKMLDKDYYTAVKDYNNAVCHGIVKIAAKMGVSTIQSYQSAQIFECLGIRQDVVDRYFTNTVTQRGRHRAGRDCGGRDLAARPRV